MNIFRPFIEPALAAGKVVLLVGLFGAGFYLGKKLEAGKCAETAAVSAKAETAAVLSRVRNNERIAEQQEIDRQRIEKAHHEELAQVRADIARAPSLRVGPAICSGFAGSAQAPAASGSDGADSGTRLLSPEMDRAVKALIEETERVAATGRACQAFVASSGLTH
ncbi:hypothetical protein [Noviherbaspirillum malthae]|uniref:hypothetical protein n=1 Tax=Noviherbaspirillum malthae TaxID=1260987 RepID=UPI001890ACE2|nr:hypothetical protein [Noviherbaspirillum malthae]